VHGCDVLFPGLEKTAQAYVYCVLDLFRKVSQVEEYLDALDKPLWIAIFERSNELLVGDFSNFFFDLG